MAEMGRGYGSEAHLLRFLGRHRADLDRRVLQELDAVSIQWLDFRFDSRATWQDAELTGLEFIDDSAVLHAWSEFWPQTGTQPTWDAVAKLSSERGDEWLLVEAKGNLEEIKRSTKAGKESRAKILDAFTAVKHDLGVPQTTDWLSGYYQFCFQIAVLWFLRHHGIRARLLYVYFVGDRHPTRTCPRDPDGWDDAIREMHEHVNLPKDHNLDAHIAEIFLNVAGERST